MSLKTFGAGAFRDAISHGIRLAEFAERCLAEMDGWEIVTSAQLATITFRFTPGGASPADCDALNRGIVEALMRDETALVTSTVLRGATVLRLCTINPRTTDRDIAATLDQLDQLARSLDR